jgi:ketosteroid isomerase-like protein
MSSAPEQAPTGADVAALAARLRHVEDLLAIGQLVATYGPTVDHGDADTVTALWVEEGVYDAAPHGRWEGREAIAGMINGGHQLGIRAGMGHVLTPPRIVVDGDTARAWNHAMNIRWDAGNDRFFVGRLSANEWLLRRVDGGWRVVERINRNLDGADEARATFRDVTVD